MINVDLQYQMIAMMAIKESVAAVGFDVLPAYFWGSDIGYSLESITSQGNMLIMNPQAPELPVMLVKFQFINQKANFSIFENVERFEKNKLGFKGQKLEDIKGIDALMGIHELTNRLTGLLEMGQKLGKF